MGSAKNSERVVEMICFRCRKIDESRAQLWGFCSSCQRILDEEDSQREKAKKREESDVASSIRSVTYKRIDQDSFLVCNKGDDIDQSHWHVANDGTILSVKEGGSYVYNRRQVRKNIREVTGIDLPLRWSQS